MVGMPFFASLHKTSIWHEKVQNNYENNAYDVQMELQRTHPELDLIVPHQANIRIIQTAAKELGLPLERFFVNIGEYGNTSSACIPVGLDQLNRAGKLTSGAKVGLVGFGAGLVYGGCVFEVE